MIESMPVLWHRYCDKQPADDDVGKCFLLFIDWQAFNPSLTAMTPHFEIGQWTGMGWMSQEDDGAWSGPVKSVTHWSDLSPLEREL